eukprot:m.289832 g.289832  ORF g.289832 m.289832 type:complete len:127 (-) comp27115_c0_seq1:129-509(-)
MSLGRCLLRIESFLSGSLLVDFHRRAWLQLLDRLFCTADLADATFNPCWDTRCARANQLIASLHWVTTVTNSAPTAPVSSGVDGWLACLTLTPLRQRPSSFKSTTNNHRHEDHLAYAMSRALHLCR